MLSNLAELVEQYKEWKMMLSDSPEAFDRHMYLSELEMIVHSGLEEGPAYSGVMYQRLKRYVDGYSGLLEGEVLDDDEV